MCVDNTTLGTLCASGRYLLNEIDVNDTQKYLDIPCKTFSNEKHNHLNGNKRNHYHCLNAIQNVYGTYSI